MAKFVRTDNCAFTKVPSLIKSAKYMGTDGATATAIENGELVAIRTLMDGEREIHVAVKPEATDTVIGVVCTPEVEYDEKGYHGLDTFTNKAGDVIRVGVLQKADIYSVGNDANTADIKAGVVTAKHIATETSGRFTYQVYEVQ